MNKGLFLGGFVQLKRYESQQNEMEKAKRHGIRHLSSLRLAMHLHPPLPPLITPTHREREVKKETEKCHILSLLSFNSKKFFIVWLQMPIHL